MSDKELFQKYAEICDYRQRHLMDVQETAMFCALRDMLRKGAKLAEEEHDHETTLKQRDYAEAMADKIADALATLLGVEIGEHSNMNCPWEQALEAFEDRPAVSTRPVTDAT